MQIVGTEGDLGDAVVLLCVLSQLEGGPHTLLLQHSTVTKMRTPEVMAVFDRVLSPLAKSQPYIKECRVEKPGEQAWWNSGGFRGKGMHAKTKTLFSAVLSHLISEKGVGRGFKSDKSWLTVEPSNKSKDRVIISRSDRYRNPHMPWGKIVKFYGDRLLFVGTENEHGRFCNESGRVEHLKTSDLLDIAEVIKGSLLFIGNQSCPMAICEGLKHPSIQETALWIPDCIYKRDNAQYSYNGAVTLPGFDKDDLVIAPVGLNPDKVSTMTTPPGYWQYPGCDGRPTFESVFQIVSALPQYKSTPRDQLRKDIIQHNIDRVPDFFSPQQEFSTVKQALAQAGY